MRAKQDRWYALDLDPGLDKALPKLLSLIGVSALVAGVLMYFSTLHWLELMAPALVACSAAAALVLWHTGLGRWSALLMFVGAMLAGTLAIWTFGSVRSFGTLIMMATTVGAAAYLPALLFWVGAAYTCLVVGAMIWLEHADRIAAHVHMPGLKDWVSTCAAVLVSGLIVLQTRREAVKASHERAAAYEDRLRVEAERQAQARLFETVFNLLPFEIYITERDSGALVEVNRAARAAVDLALGPDSPERGLRPVLWSQDQQRAEFVQCLVQQGSVRAKDVPHPVGKDHDRFIRLWAELVTLGAGPCIVTCVEDVTQDKRRERQLRELVTLPLGSQGSLEPIHALVQMAAAVTHSDAVLVCERLDEDEHCQILTRHLSREPAEGFTLPAPGTRFAGADALQALTPAGAQVRHLPFEADARVLGGLHLFWWQQRSPLGKDGEMLLGLIAMRLGLELKRLQQDRTIAELNAQLEAKVQRRTRRLMELNHELKTFAYSISHDIRSPLRSIHGFVELLREDLADQATPQQHALMERVMGATLRMETLVNGLLSLAHTLQWVPQLQPTDLSALARAVIDELRLVGDGQRIDFRVQDGLSATCDPVMTSIVMAKLLSNSIKFTRDTPVPVIEVGSTTEADRPGTFFYVRDNGCGFDMQYYDKLFQPFQKLHLPQARFEGHGLGLATASRIVLLQGGEMFALSSPGIGASFFFSFGTVDADLSSERSELQSLFQNRPRPAYSAGD